MIKKVILRPVMCQLDRPNSAEQLVQGTAVPFPAHSYLQQIRKIIELHQIRPRRNRIQSDFGNFHWFGLNRNTSRNLLRQIVDTV